RGHQHHHQREQSEQRSVQLVHGGPLIRSWADVKCEVQGRWTSSEERHLLGSAFLESLESVGLKPRQHAPRSCALAKSTARRPCSNLVNYLLGLAASTTKWAPLSMASLSDRLDGPGPDSPNRWSMPSSVTLALCGNG